jgi:tricorn protease
MSTSACRWLALLAWLACAAAPAWAGEGFYRFPALRGQTLVFTAEGDLWRVGAAGGRAERITTHPDLESRAALSPDGRLVAFSGTYERAGEAYLMPLEGGLPQRLTWDGQNPRVWGFTPAGEVLVTAPSTRGQPVTQLFAIDPKSLGRRTLPVGQASDGALSPDGQTLFFTRSGLASDNVRAYRGGALAQLWRISLANLAEAVPLLPPEGNAQRPMPYTTPLGLRVAFLSDRDGQFNLWSVAADGSDLRQHTRHRGWDIRHASIDGSRVVYALGADLRLVDLASGQDEKLAITLGGDADAQRQRWVPRAQANFESATPSPDGARVALSLRGRLVTQGTGPLRRAELPVPSDARCREAVFSHDSRHVYALCDIAVPGGPQPAEQEIWRFAADGSGSPLQITRDGSLRRMAILPSPDGQWLAHTDLSGRILLTAISAQGGGASRVVDVPDRRGRPPAMAWSPDGRALAFLRAAGSEGTRGQLLLHEVAAAKNHVLSSERYGSDSPAFTPDGRWLYFLSDRQFTPLTPSPWGDRAMGVAFDRRTKVYALALQPGLRWPFQPRDELQPAADGADAGDVPAAPVTTTATASAGAASATASVTTTPAAPRPASPPRPLPAIDYAGLASRLFEVPMAAGNYRKLRSDGRRLYLLEADSTPERRTGLRTQAIEPPLPPATPPELFAADVNDFELTPGGRRLMLVRRAATGPQPGDIQLFDAAAKAPDAAPQLARAQVRWADTPIATQPAAEWRQMFDDAWRLHRDHFWDPAMQGADWPAVRRKYAALLPRVGDRWELSELLAQMVAEVATLHSQIATPDPRRGADDIPPAGLGARLAKAEGGFRIEHIYRSDPELPAERAPLAIAGAQAGDLITHVNGQPLTRTADLGELLRGQAERQVLLGLKAASGAERRVVVLPVSGQRESQLRMGDWEQGRAERAAARSEGRVGYLRLRAMVPEDLTTFVREFYAQLDRGALVIDVRGNGGGNIDSWIIEKLMRRAWAFWQPRQPEGGEPYANMQGAFRGPVAVLVDEQTYSDGETFAEGVKRLGLGTLVGKRTAGAGVWLSDRNNLADGGRMRAAESGQFALDGSWLIEGRGVQPDVEVDNPPRASFDGGDAQLDTAVELLKRQLAGQPPPKPVAPPRPKPTAPQNAPVAAPR